MRTFAKPIAFSFRTAHSRARAFRFRPGQARPDFGREPFHDVPGMIVLERSFAQLLDLRLADLGGSGSGKRESEQGEGGDAEKELFHPARLGAHVRFANTAAAH
jgi:hypothetical protein